jgi:DNA-3-methyladenine glycosylase II
MPSSYSRTADRRKQERGVPAHRQNAAAYHVYMNKKLAATYRQAQRHLTRRDRVLKKVIAQVGPCTLRHEPDRFVLLVRAIISQQISGKAATSIGNRLLEVLGKDGICPAGILRLSEKKMREAGLSGAKTRAVRDLADKVVNGEVCLEDLHRRDDEEIVAHLDPVWGIGRWTAEMFLIFSLGRMDVLPVHDLGLRAGVQRTYGLRKMPSEAQLVRLAEPWQPYRTIATWYIWRSLGAVPQSS